MHSYPNHPNKPNTPILNMSSYLEQNLSFYTVRHLPPPPSHPPPTLTNTPQVPAAFALVMVPHAYGVALAGRNYDLAK